MSFDAPGPRDVGQAHRTDAAFHFHEEPSAAGSQGGKGRKGRGEAVRSEPLSAVMNKPTAHNHIYQPQNRYLKVTDFRDTL